MIEWKEWEHEMDDIAALRVTQILQTAKNEE
jgi:hypothetical protein